jgi:pimeloyl-ACP methyl ester carboxylesterase
MITGGALAALLLGGCCGGGGTAEAAAAGVAADRSPHQSRFVTVNGVRLHYLDWGGQGETLLLLPGLGDNAHIYDDLAPKFTRQYRVLALTRRGFGESDQPPAGYDVETLTADVKGFVDALGLPRVHLVGHSIAGNEMTRFAALYPERVGRMVYLDAAIERSGGAGEGGAPAAATGVAEDFTPPAPTPEDFSSYRKARQFFQRTSVAWSPAMENSFRNALVILPNGSVLPRTPDTITAALMEEAAKYRAEFARIEAPALALFAAPGTIYDLFPWFPQNPAPESQAAAEQTVRFAQMAAAAQAAQFEAEAPRGRSVVLPDTVHYLHIQRSDEVVSRIRDFLGAR